MASLTAQRYSDEELVAQLERIQRHAERNAATGAKVRKPWDKLKQIDLVLAAMTLHGLLTKAAAMSLRKRLQRDFAILE